MVSGPPKPLYHYHVELGHTSDMSRLTQPPGDVSACQQMKEAVVVICRRANLASEVSVSAPLKSVGGTCFYLYLILESGRRSVQV